MPDYQAWLEKHNKTIEKGKKLIKKYGFKVIIIQNDKKSSFLRIKFGRKKVDFQVKTIKTKFVRSIWLCKKERFNRDDFYLLYASKEKSFSVASGHDIDREGEYRDSEWAKGTKYIVVQNSVFRPANPFFKLMKSRYEGELQQRMNQWL